MSDAPTLRVSAEAGGHAHPSGAARVVGWLRDEVVHPMHEGDVAIDLDHEVAMLRSKLLRKMREYLLPQPAHRVRPDRAMRGNGVIENGFGRIGRHGCRRILRLDRTGPICDQRANFRFVLPSLLVRHDSSPLLVLASKSNST